MKFPQYEKISSGTGEGLTFNVSTLAQTDALAKLLFEKGLINQAEFMQKLSVERVGNHAHPRED